MQYMQLSDFGIVVNQELARVRILEVEVIKNEVANLQK